MWKAYVRKGLDMTENYLRANASPTDLLRIARVLKIPLTDEEAQIVAFGVYQRGTDMWNRRESIRARLGARCVSYGVVDNAPRYWGKGHDRK